ncbi:MAG TPA: Stk1 family PASTA domain-containing Ser/Thr kinase [Acidimicrobiales bacterium]|nr:Stk1 family PASTA domain-containing Ser/Thr kinase [Acidimicrobiales bacterium]
MAQRAQVFNGRYEIVRPIARGGMADVFLARDQLLDRPVALKVLFPELSVDRSFVERFRREAQAAANLAHPNVVSVYDFGEEDGISFIVMEFVDGRTLTSVLRSEGTLLADRAATIGADVAAALAFAHRNGVVHRDVKPGNVLIDNSGHVKVTDFGIARAANSEENLTQAGAVMGTATYFSPEQAQGHDVDGRSDVYSLGVVLYEMVTGQAPFTGDNPVSIAYKHVQEVPPTPRSLNPAVPPAFEAIVLQAMAKNPDQRYASAEELRADLLRFRQGRAVAAVPPTAAMAATSVQQAVGGDRTRMVAATEIADAPSPRRTGAYVALLLVMLAALAVLLFLLGRTLGIFGGEGGPATVTVPSVIGKTADEAERMLTSSGLRVERKLEHNQAALNTVFKQDPGGGEKIPKDSLVTITISQGEALVKVPSVVGDNVDDATDELRTAGFEVQTTSQPDRSAPAGRVLSQDPRGGAEAQKGSVVKLAVSSGKPKVTVPNVANKDETAARDDIVNAGLKVKTVQEASDTVPQGKVIRTDPTGGTEVDEGATVTIFVSSGPAQVDVPNVVGMTEEEATKKLKDAGFQVKVQTRPVTDEEDDKRVIDQDPDVGTKRPKGSVVTITVGQLVGGGSD